MAQVSLIREPDDPMGDRISLGRPHNTRDWYMVFRGDPKNIINLLEDALAVAKIALPNQTYADKRGRPQG